jgi:phage terminase large subunit
MAIELPNEWEARVYQQPLMNFLFSGGLDEKRAAEVWHRRAGKDSCCLNVAAVAGQMRVGTIWHMLPSLKQGRRVIWDGIDKYGRRMIDQAFPPEMRSGINASDMQIRFTNGSIYQVVGSDNYDSLVGANPVGVIFSEWSIADPAAWDYIKPILIENGGWALFIYTPRGKNHGYKTYEAFKRMADGGNPKYHAQILTIEDTILPDGQPVVPMYAIEEAREEGWAEEKIQQEFYCSWDAGLEGAFFTRELKIARDQGRIGDFPFDPAKLCQSTWDLGFRDRNAIGITQRHESGAPIFIDYLEGRNTSLDQWIKTVRELPYDYEEHWGPHDLAHHEYTHGRTRLEVAQELGFSFDVVEKIAVVEGIENLRRLIRVAYFNEPMVERLLECLGAYRREYDERQQLYKDKPVHDWSSHGTDMARYLATWWDYQGGATRRSSQQYEVVSAFSGQGRQNETDDYGRGAMPHSVRRAIGGR